MLGFELYAVLFSVLGISRVAAAVLLAISNRGTVPLSAGVLRVLASISSVPALTAVQISSG